ncbi:hypothetical protein KIH74_23015 [Kineosporia sp. J2-2]|uniref:Uncharacterized protein n=1 Tax=Kineosporia corallincola TaxID=2835133 RepID=A0ABS5TL72_9ACTN|nr:hypothetical protein [Kineosporia corallincola]MBT0771831.1 hypothetical protein [Kineosporia corallincola]
MSLICSICLYHPAPDGEDTDTLTVINGHLTCVYHAGFVAGADHGQALIAVLRQHEGG